MQYLAKIELSDFMNLSECADWLAFGRLPRADVELDRHDDPCDGRLSVDSILELGSSPYSPSLYFDTASLSRLLPSADPSEYQRNFMLCGGKRPAESKAHNETHLQQMISALKLQEDDPDPELSLVRLSLDRELQASIWLERVSSPLYRMLDRAQFEIFQAVADGKVASRGVFIENDLRDKDDGVWPTEVISIPANEWMYDHVQWDLSNLKTLDGEYWGITVETARVLALFPKPSLTPVGISGQLFGETLLVDQATVDIGTATRPANRKGAPSTGQNVIKEALVKEYLQRKSSGTLPSKGEAMIAAAQEWVRERIGMDIARSTVQRYLEPFQGKKPRNSAQN